MHTYTRKLVYAVLSMHDAQYQTCLRQVFINFSHSSAEPSRTVAALHQGAPGQMTWREDPPPWLRLA